MPNPEIQLVLGHQKHGQNSTKSTLFTQKRGRGRHGLSTSLEPKKNRPLVLGLSNHHLIDVGAGCTTSLPHCHGEGKKTWLKYDEIVKSLLEYVEKSLILRSIEIYLGMLRCIEKY